MYYVVIACVSLIVLVCYILLQYFKYEHFQVSAAVNGITQAYQMQFDGAENGVLKAPLLKTQPLTIYYTKEINKCNAPGTYFIGNIQDESYRINFAYDVSYYKALYKELQKKYTGVNRSPTPQENAILIEIDDLIKEYDKFIDHGKIFCKHNIANLQHFASTTEDNLLGDIPQNKSRGSPEHWVLLGKKRNLPSMNYVGVRPVATVGDHPEPYYIQVNGKDDLYSLNVLMDYSKETVKDMFCKENGRGIGYTMRSGICYNPNSKKLLFIKDSALVEASRLTDWDIIRYFRFLFRTQKVVDNDASLESVVVKPESFTRQLVRLRKNICDTIQKELTPVNATLRFTDVAIIKEIQKSAANRYYQGTSKDMRSMDAELNKDIATRRETMRQAHRTYRASKREYNEFKKLYPNLIIVLIIMYRLRLQFIQLSNNQRYMQSGRGQRRVYRTIDLLNDALQRQKLRIEAYHMRLQQHKANIQTQYNKYQAALDSLRYYMRIKNNLNDYIRFMNRKLISSIRQLLIQNKVKIDFTSSTIVPEYLRYLSHDGNLYILLE